MAGLRFRAAWILGGLLCLVLSLGACGGSAGGGDAGSGEGGPDSGGKMEEGVSGSGSLAGSAGGDIAQAPNGGDSAASAGGEAGTALPENFDRRIIKSADLGLQAENVRGSAERVQGVASRYGGSVLNSSVDERGKDIYAKLVVSVPAQDFDDALEDLRSLPGKVTKDSISGQDVTEEFVDLESRERNLLAAEESLLELYERAESVEDTLIVERELANVRGQIEQVQGRMKFLESRTEFSRISIDIATIPAPNKPEPGWQPARVVSESWDASLVVLQGAATALISVLVFGWIWIPILITAAFFWKRRNRTSESAADGPPAA